MSYWHYFHRATAFHGQYWLFAPGFIASTIVLIAMVPAAKRRLTVSLLLFLLSVAGMFIAAAIACWDPDHDNDLGYKWVRFPALILQAIATVNVLAVFVFRFLLNRIRLEPPPILRDLILAAAYGLLAISISSQAGMHLAGLVTASAIVSAVIGFSLQDTLTNIMAGMSIQLERTITVGDWIRFENREGIVREVRWRQTSIETKDGDTILVPNAQIMKNAVTLVGRRMGQPAQHRQWVSFTLDYRYAPTNVMAVVNDALIEPIEHVVAEPRPYCVVGDLKDTVAMYSVCFWIDDLVRSDTSSSAVRARIYAALQRGGMPLPAPADPDAVKQKKTVEEADVRFKLLRDMSIFKPLTDEEIKQIADRLRVAPFIKGEAMTRQGSSANYLYILAKGQAEVRLDGDGQVNRKIAALGAGDFFGEMGLLTGAPRSATVIATADCVCYRLDKDGFTDIVKGRPEIVEGISKVLSRRRAELDAARENMSEAARHLGGHEQDMIRRIRNFFFS